MAALDRQLDFERLTLHPEFSASLKDLFDKIPPRNSTLIRAASEYRRTDLPWTVRADGTHELCAEGYPSDTRLYVTTSAQCRKPDSPFHLGAYFALKPTPDARDASALRSVIGTFGGELRSDTFGFGAIIDMVARMITQVYGDLEPPWDTVAGSYNHHDVASRDRFRRDFPTVDDKFHEYLKYDNILNEFDGPGGPYVLLNFSAEINSEPLKKYPELYKFYTAVGPTLTTTMDITNGAGGYWMRDGFDHGKIRITFMVRDGKLSAFDSDYHPIGEPIALQDFRSGSTRSSASAHIRRLGMDFGLEDLSFTNYFTRDDSGVTFESRMDAVPRIVAPIGIEQGAQLIAGEFMRTMAQGSGGMRSQVSSKVFSDGAIEFTSEQTAEFAYSPAMEFFANLGDAIADKDNEKVRQEGRALSQEFLDAFLKDYNDARSRIAALDRDPALAK